MAFIGEEQFSQQLAQKAIELAMLGKWWEAITINRMIIEENPNDVEAYNRLGRALVEVGRYKEAIEAYEQAVKLDPHNKIALKNLSRLQKLKGKTDETEGYAILSHPFLEEAGRSGRVDLINLAPAEVLAKINAGEEVVLKIEDTRLIVLDKSGTYLGEVEPKYAHRLIKLMEGGNQYSAAIAELNGGVKVFICEIYQHPSQVGRLPFPVKKVEHQPYLKDTLLRHEEREALDYEEEE